MRSHPIGRVQAECGSIQWKIGGRFVHLRMHCPNLPASGRPTSRMPSQQYGLDKFAQARFPRQTSCCWYFRLQPGEKKLRFPIKNLRGKGMLLQALVLLHRDFIQSNYTMKVF